MESTKKQPHQALSLEKKLQILQDLGRSGLSKTQVAKKFNIPKSTLSRILKNKEAIEGAVKSGTFTSKRMRMRTTPNGAILVFPYGPHGTLLVSSDLATPFFFPLHQLIQEKRFRMRKAAHPNVKSALLMWLRDARARGIPVNGLLLRSRAEQLAVILGHGDVTSSEGWLSRTAPQDPCVPSVWPQIQEAFGAKDFADFVSFDDGIVDSEQLTDDEIAALVKNSSDPLSEDDSSEETEAPVKLSSSQAMDYIEALKGYFLQQQGDCSAEVLQLTEMQLKDLVGQYKKQYRSCVPECLVLYFALELITTLEQVHSCSIIHADVKPDNILVIDLPSKAGFLDDFAEQGPSCLQLIDFGRGIDMTKFPPGTTFTHVVTTDGFVCTEMRDNRPWTFQTDWFGLLGCLHVLLFGDYMDVEKLPNNTWGIRNKFKRYWQQDLWNGLFSTLLNIPSCSELPDLTPFKLEIQSLLRNKSRAHNVVLEALRAKNF
ncbi:hypothetical protein HPB50_008180 [Hyalomma asiaticum]|uniref:Uncharacterized protein n=1 Tax=Hyalomma asiaticum TaxID=266040 RepID=A0ACB7RYQ0_HYAAI|nr:hypothetical protein HPB50_008180 [Hyalomma asiaticum]